MLYMWKNIDTAKIRYLKIRFNKIATQATAQMCQHIYNSEAYLRP